MWSATFGFLGPEVVIYRFSRNRDATVMNEVLKGFGGVLVSDFYNVYDSAPCLQQKCLIHLIRDINDDLLKFPFDEELKELATRFTSLMTPIIESIDRYGLTKRHLGKFVGDAERCRKWVTGQQFGSKIAQGYQKRVGKYGDRLFTFLSHDGVPWHNDLAENGVKLVVSRRRLVDGLMSEEGITRYLTFLSIYQTLRRKGGSFLRFLLSNKTDVFEFWASSVESPCYGATLAEMALFGSNLLVSGVQTPNPAWMALSPPSCRQCQNVR